LNRLLLASRQPIRTVEEFGTELAATRDQPPEVSSAQRAAHLALLSATLFFPLLFMFLMPAFYTTCLKAGRIFGLGEMIRHERRIVKDHQDGMRRDFLSSLLQADPFVRADGLLRLAADRRMQTALEDKLDRDRDREERLRPSAGWMALALLTQMDEGDSVKPHPLGMSGDFRQDAETAIAFDEPVGWEMLVENSWVVGLVFVLVFPVIWLVWAFLLRSGFTSRLAGIALRRSNGRKALRIQCVWRTVLVWLPVAA